MRFAVFAAAALLGLTTSSGLLSAPAATVNGVPITREEYVSALETTAVAGPKGVQSAGAAALERLISEIVLIELAEKEGVPVTDEQVGQRLRAAEKDGSLAETMKSRRMTLEEVKRELRARQAFVNVAARGVQVTDGEVADYYFKNVSRYKQPAKIRIAIVAAKSKSKIDLVSSRLKTGEDFGAVAVELSEDAISKPSGGVLGWVWQSQPGVPPAVWGTAATLKVGAVSKPVRIGDQWIIMKAIERKRPALISLDEARDGIREEIAVGRGVSSGDFQQKLRDAQEQSIIEIAIERFKDLGAELKAGAVPQK